MLVRFVSVLCMVVPQTASAHAGEPVAPHDLWSAWAPNAEVLLVVGSGLLLYGMGVRALWGRAGLGRGIRVWQAAAYAGGLLWAVLALMSPLDALGSVLFSGHMVQHLVLMLVAAPLIVLGEPLLVFVWALPAAWRREAPRFWRRTGLDSAWRVLTHPLTVWTLNLAVTWMWHIPALFQRSLTSEAVHTLQHLSFLGAALLFWWCVVDFARRGRQHGTAIIFIFTTMMHSMALGVIIASSLVLLYPEYVERTRRWGVDPLEDQQLAGLIMWMPPGLIYVAAVAVLLVRWIAAAERRARQREANEHTRQATEGTSNLVYARHIRAHRG